MQTSGYYIIKEASFGLKHVCGVQRYIKGEKYRLSTFVIKASVECGELIYSTITGELTFVTNWPMAYKYLINNWFYVNENIDEKEFIFKIWKLMRCVKTARPRGFKTFEIVTTTQCNAQCYYCYESLFERISMNQEVADKVITFIKNTKEHNDIRLKWYGGEPLMNVGVINQICRGLQENNVSFHSTMISNGYLFTDQLITKAKDLWYLRNVTVTLDGTKEVYNKSKNYIGHPKNAFEKVISNIDKLLIQGINVTIRFNIEKQNINSITELMDMLLNKYHNYKNIKFMLKLLNNTTQNKSIQSSEIERSQLLDRITLLKNRIYEKGFDVECGKLSGITGSACIANNQKYILIKPDGNLAYCSMDFNKKNFGNVFNRNDKISYPDLDSGFIDKPPICEDCPLFPICSPSTLCPACIGSFCNQKQKEYNISEVIMAMKIQYRNKYEA